MMNSSENHGISHSCNREPAGEANGTRADPAKFVSGAFVHLAVVGVTHELVVGGLTNSHQEKYSTYHC